MSPIEFPDSLFFALAFTGWLLVLFLLPGEDAPGADEVRGRRTGSSGCASPSSRTERRAERTLDPPRPDTASALESGAAPPPRAPEPSAARVG